MKFNNRFIIAAFLMIISNLGWILPVVLIPFLEISLEQKALYVMLCVIFGQVTYNVGLLMIGAQLLKRLKIRGVDFKSMRAQTMLLIKNIQKRTKFNKIRAMITKCF